MFLPYSILVLGILIASARGAIKIEKAEIETMDKQYFNTEVKVREEGGIHKLDIEADILQDLPENLFMQIHIEKKGPSGFATLYKSDIIDKCHFAENREKYQMEKALTDDFEKYGNLLQKCPVKKGHYYMRGFVFEARDIIAQHMTPGQYRVRYTIFAKMGTEMKNLFSLVMHGSA